MMDSRNDSERREVVRQRYDLMSNEEIAGVLAEWVSKLDSSGKMDQLKEVEDGLRGSESSRTINAIPISSNRSGSGPQAPNPTSTHTFESPISAPSDSPLFPPSPTSCQATLPGDLDISHQQPDHPLRELARAVKELHDTVERLRAENEGLRRELRQASRGRIRGDKIIDTMSLHDGLNEAISTSLTSPAPVFSVQSTHQSRPLNPPRNASPASSLHSLPPGVIPHHRQSNFAQSIDPPLSSNRSARSVDIKQSDPLASSSRSIRSVDSRQYESVLPSNRSIWSVNAGDGGSESPGRTVRKRDAARSSWTSSLWGWGGSGTAKKVSPKDRRGSISSLRAEIKAGNSVLENDEDNEEWRKGDGGSSPAFRAIFLATRLVTPDPSSILIFSHITSSSLVAILAHSLISHARDQEITARDPPNTRRRLSQPSRNRAASVFSQDSQRSGNEESGVKEKSYGETLAATALYGRSILSSMSGATIRASKPESTTGGKVEIGDTARPSLLNRTSGRTFPTTALSPSVVMDVSSTNATEDGLPLPSVEMASVVSGENQPPTVLLSRQNLGLYFYTGKTRPLETATRFKGAEPPLTDRYGFIYDLQHAAMLKDASAAGVPPPASLSGLIPGMEEGEGWIEKRRRGSHERRPDLGSRRSTGSVENTHPSSPSLQPSDLPSTGSSGVSTPTRAERRNNRSSTIISLNPSPARPVIAKDNLTVSARGASSLRTVASPQSEHLPELLPDQPIPPSSTISRATVSSLLDQLTELHDRQQAERKVEWDAWLHKRKRKKGVNTNQGQTSWGGDLIGISQMGSADSEEWRVFAKLVRHGIPLAYRADIWAELSGARDALVPGEYREILAVHANDTSPVLADIEKDVSRTFPANIYYGGDGPGVAKLRRVLIAYSWRNPRVAYCQGMNMLAATLLLAQGDEEQAFWVLSALIDRLLPVDFYSPSLLSSRADQLVLADLVEVHLPNISAKLADLGIDLASITFGWLLSLFTNCLPVETLFRVWDLLFLDGHDTLFRVALAILKLNEGDICSAESAGDLLTSVGGMTARLWAADKLIAAQHGYRSTVRHSDITTRYSRHLASLQDV